MTGLHAVIDAAIDDYRTETPAEQQTPAGLTDRITEYLASSGYPTALDTGSPA
ncbi:MULTISPECIES: hypothetical protein [unclassified Streptomyces]|uniref:hypothetical protein n=1 Tax=unclassified Streptomyces TaxID=2593676 RepID=UPI001301573F|nr:hypothetical protein [Streptomyces sp. CB02366]